jgi:DNA-binding IclR family transcriptional regulator
MLTILATPITDPDVLMDELRRVRDEGYAEDNLESSQGLRALAAPVFDAAGVMVAAVSVPFIGEATPDRKRSIRKEVADVADTLTRLLGGAPRNFK